MSVMLVAGMASVRAREKMLDLALSIICTRRSSKGSVT